MILYGCFIYDAEHFERLRGEAHSSKIIPITLAYMYANCQDYKIIILLLFLLTQFSTIIKLLIVYRFYYEYRNLWPLLLLLLLLYNKIMEILALICYNSHFQIITHAQ